MGKKCKTSRCSPDIYFIATRNICVLQTLPVLVSDFSGKQSTVTSPDHPDLEFDLQLLRSDPTYEEPEQLWEFKSKFAVCLFLAALQRNSSYGLMMSVRPSVCLFVCPSVCLSVCQHFG